MAFIGGVTEKFKKSRHDGVTDRFSRIFMRNIFIISATIMTIDFFTDRMTCYVGRKSNAPIEFAQSACWVNGLYIFDDAMLRKEESSYYGIPKDITINGKDLASGNLCTTESLFNTLIACEPLKRTYYDQYQYFPFYIASLAIIFYLPYIFFKACNSDMSSLINDIKRQKDVEEKEEYVSEKITSGLHSSMKGNKGDVFAKENAKRIAIRYFNYEENGGVLLLRLKTLANLVLKATYVAVNLGGFHLTDSLLNNKFINYGMNSLLWFLMPRYQKYQSGIPKPGNELLPAMGYCDFKEASTDTRTTFYNNSRFVCEISTHILYQYVLLVLWCLFVAGILMSSVGFILHLFDIATVFVKCSLPKTEFNQKFGLELFVREPMYRACRKLTLREIEYMRYIRKHDYALYHGIVRIIQPECVLDIPTHL